MVALGLGGLGAGVAGGQQPAAEVGVAVDRDPDGPSQAKPARQLLDRPGRARLIVADVDARGV